MNRLPCALCNGPVLNFFTSAEALEGHILRAHCGLLPWECTLCAGQVERYAMKEQLKQHYRSDHGVVEYEVSYSPQHYPSSHN